MKSAFVTGSTGFLGKALVPRLLEEGFQVTCLARKPDVNLFHKSVKWSVGDLNQSEEALASLLQNHTHVFHLAGLIGYKKKLLNEMFQVNVLGTEKLLKASIKKNIEVFFYTSSVAAIGAGRTKNEILNEESSYNLTKESMGYFDTKHLAEERLKQIASVNSIKTLLINPSTIYGPGDTLKSSRSVQVKVAKGTFPFYPPGGVNVVHLEDIIDGIMIVLDKGKKNQRYIFANQNLLIKELFEKIAYYSGQKAPQYPLKSWQLKALGQFGDLLEFVGINSSLSSENAKVSCFYHWFDNNKAQNELGMKFRSSDLAIEESVKWLLKNKN